MYTENVAFQIGPVVGDPSSGVNSQDCENYNPPLSKDCTWQYYDNDSGWKIDDTITLKCQGGKWPLFIYTLLIYRNKTLELLDFHQLIYF